MNEFDLKKFKEALGFNGVAGDPIDGLDDLDEFEIVDEGEWISDYKYETQDTVYKHLPTGRFVNVSQSRQGSYYTDYNYMEPYLCEVRPVEVVRTVYNSVGPLV